MVAVGDDIDAADINLLLLKPLVRLVQQSAQSMANGANSPISFGAGSEEIDTDNYHDTVSNTTRITPTKAGYYKVNGTVNVAVTGALTILTAFIARNGIAVQPFNRTKPGTASTTCSAQAEAIVQLDGVLDYVELYGNQTSGGALNSQASGGVNSVLELEYLRPI